MTSPPHAASYAPVVGVDQLPAGGSLPWWRRHTVRARAADALYLLAGAAATVTDIAEAARTSGRALAVVAALTGALGTVALLWRRSRPLLPVVLSVPSILPGTQLGVFPLAILALAIRRRDRVLWIAAVSGYVVSILAATRRPDSLGGALISNVFTLGLPMAAGAYVGARRDLVASLRARAEQAEAELALRADQARLAERTRIAQEMHDVLAHRISLIGLHAGGLEVQPDAAPDVVERSAALIRQTARSALDDLRGVLGVLRADETTEGLDLAPQPQLRDVPRLVESSRAAGIAVTLVDRLPDGASEQVPELTGRTVYRVIQEALTNVHKHARDAATTVTLEGATGDGLAVDVVNVRPVAADSLLPGAGVGLVGLRERVGLVGGTLEAGATPEGGWRVQAWFPWPAP